MARKPAKELTAEEVLKQQREQQLRFMEDKINNLNEPTYKFEIGDKVTYGAFKECTVTDILYDGKVYGLNCISIEEKYGVQSKEEAYRVATWVDVRPIPTGDSNFSRNNDVRINFINSNIESLLHKYYSFGVNMNPDYQRDYVWKLEDKQLLIDSIFNNIEIGKFAFIHSVSYTHLTLPTNSLA